MTTRKNRGVTGVWLRPTTRTERALQDAQEHARKAGYGLAQSWHLLLALIQEPQSFSALLLGRLGVTPQDLSDEVARIEKSAQAHQGGRQWAEADRRGLARDDHGTPSSAGASLETPPTEQAWTQSRADLLDAAREEAQRLGDTYVGTEHLLLGLLRVEGNNDPALRNLGVTWERAQAALTEARAQTTPSAAAAP